MKRLLPLLLLAPAQVGAFSLEFPLDCVLGETCHIQQYVDRDPGPGHQDFSCGPLSYQGHSGTDFALPTLAAMRAGVAVLAAAPGTVKGLRDGMADVASNAPDATDIAGRECGNGLVIDHGDGWETQYCHMARGSLRHKSGDAVATGETIGLVGLSGNTEFPHLHLSLRKNGEMLDPFSPETTVGCATSAAPDLWQSDITYQPGGFLGLGLTTAVPQWEAIKAGLPQTAAETTSPALVVWAHYFGNRAQDQLVLSIISPDGGEIISETLTLERTQAAGFRAVGRRVRGADWPSGSYQLNARLTRDGKLIDEMTTSTSLR